MPLTIHNAFTCDVCGLKITKCIAGDNYPAGPGYVTDQILPKSWVFIGRTLVCHRHSIVVAPPFGKIADGMMVRRALADDEAGFRSDEAEAFEQDVPSGINKAFGRLEHFLLNKTLEPLQWATIKSPPVMATASTADRIVCKLCQAEWINQYRFCPNCGDELTT